MKITLYNDFHNTSIALYAKGNKLTIGQVKKAQKELCGIAGCCCSGEFGVRGQQDWHIELDYSQGILAGAVVIGSREEYEKDEYEKYHKNACENVDAETEFQELRQKEIEKLEIYEN